MVLRMRRLQNGTKIMRSQKPGRMRNVRNTGKQAGRLWKAVDCCRRLMKSRELRRTVEVLSLMQVSKAFGDRERQGMPTMIPNFVRHTRLKLHFDRFVARCFCLCVPLAVLVAPFRSSFDDTLGSM